MNRSELALASFVDRYECNPTLRPVILNVRRQEDLRVCRIHAAMGIIAIYMVTGCHSDNRPLGTQAMTNQAKIIGVHKVDAEEPVYLIEIELLGDIKAFDFEDVTQVMPDRPRANWQAAFDEREVQSPTANRRFAFFFHYLDLDLPLTTSLGDLPLPDATPIPERLADIRYESP
jgi:hypothetical protein